MRNAKNGEKQRKYNKNVFTSNWNRYKSIATWKHDYKNDKTRQPVEKTKREKEKRIDETWIEVDEIYDKIAHNWPITWDHRVHENVNLFIETEQ